MGVCRKFWHKYVVRSDGSVHGDIFDTVTTRWATGGSVRQAPRLSRFGFIMSVVTVDVAADFLVELGNHTDADGLKVSVSVGPVAVDRSRLAATAYP